MFKKILMVFIAGIFILVVTRLFAQSNAEHRQEETIEASSREVLNVGNKICPVSGEKIAEKTKATYEYEGKIYNFCRSMCIDEFKKDPEKYTKKIKEELKGKQKKKTKENLLELEETEGMPEIHLD